MNRILVADDDDAYRKLLCTVLRRAGYEVEEASNGADTLVRFDKRPPDLLVTDILMPGKDGIETMLELRSRCPSTPIIAISGGGRIQSGDFLDIALKLGAKRTLAKPFSNADLVAAVQEVIGRSS